jgi:hypothetical protein
VTLPLPFLAIIIIYAKKNINNTINKYADQSDTKSIYTVAPIIYFIT